MRRHKGRQAVQPRRRAGPGRRARARPGRAEPRCVAPTGRESTPSSLSRRPMLPLRMRGSEPNHATDATARHAEAAARAAPGKTTRGCSDVGGDGKEPCAAAGLVGRDGTLAVQLPAFFSLGRKQIRACKSQGKRRKRGGRVAAKSKPLEAACGRSTPNFFPSRRPPQGKARQAALRQRGASRPRKAALPCAPTRRSCLFPATY